MNFFILVFINKHLKDKTAAANTNITSVLVGLIWYLKKCATQARDDTDKRAKAYLTTMPLVTVGLAVAHAQTAIIIRWDNTYSVLIIFSLTPWL